MNGRTKRSHSARLAKRDLLFTLHYKGGNSIREIAIKFSCSSGCVEKALHRCQVKMRPQGTPRNDFRDTLIALEYLESVMSIADIAKRREVNRNTVYRALARRGVDLRLKVSKARAPYVHSPKQLSITLSHDSIGV